VAEEEVTVAGIDHTMKPTRAAERNVESAQQAAAGRWAIQRPATDYLRLCRLTRRIRIVRDLRRARLAHPLLAQRLVLPVVLDARAVILGRVILLGP